MTAIALRTLSLRPGEEHRALVDVDVEPFLLGGIDYPVIAPPRVELVIQRTVSGNVFGFRFSARLSGPCMRCLAPAEVEVHVDAHEYEAEDPNAPDDLRTEYVVEGELDLSAWARDQIAFALPERILCRHGCAGLCPVCGVDLNLEPHVHEEASRDPRWEALEALRRDDG